MLPQLTSQFILDARKILLAKFSILLNYALINHVDES